MDPDLLERVCLCVEPLALQFSSVACFLYIMSLFKEIRSNDPSSDRRVRRRSGQPTAHHHQHQTAHRVRNRPHHNSPRSTQLHSNRHVSCIQPVCPPSDLQKTPAHNSSASHSQAALKKSKHTSLPKTSSPMPSRYRKQWNHTASYRSKSSNRYSTRSSTFTQTVTSIRRKGSSSPLRHS